jgi:tripartite-type tricarboxylate transporter receptor subunit TctC
MPSRRAIILVAALLVGLLPAHADYPERIVRIVVAAPAGGPSDTVTRLVIEAVTRRIGRPWAIVENIGTAGGTLGVERVARAAGDGYTLLAAGTGSLTVAPAVRTISYDATRDFAPVILLNRTSVIAIAHPATGLRTLDDLIARARPAPGKLDFATSGRGLLPHLIAMALARQSGITLTHVPYRGEQNAVSDLLGGHIGIGFIGLPTVAPHLKSGALIALGNSASEPYPDFAIPPIAATVPGFDMSGWFGLLAPAGTPAPIIAWLNRALHEVLSDPEVQDKLRAGGSVAAGSPPEVLGRQIARDLVLFGEVARAFDIRAD